MSRVQAWTAAARIHTLPAAIVPVMAGTALACGEGVCRFDAFAWALIGAPAIQVAANFANDVSDAEKGADTADRIGPPRMVAEGIISRNQMWTATWLAVGVAGLAGVALTIIAGPLIPIIGIASVVALLGYVGGPVPYGYRGFGELSAFVFFGVVATVGSRYVQDMTAPLDAWLLAIPIGMGVTAILVANNYRDIDTDRETGKRTLAVIMGGKRTRTFFAVLVYGSFLLIALFALTGLTPFATVFAALLTPAAISPVRIIYAKTEGPALTGCLKRTARLHLWTGVVLAVGALV